MSELPLNTTPDTAGLDDPGREWMKHEVRLTKKPELGTGRVIRWFPPKAEGEPAMLRVQCQNARAPELVSEKEVEILR